MTAVSTILADMYKALGRSDTDVQTIALRGINFGHTLCAALFAPPELKTSGSLTISAAGTSTSLSGLTRLLELDFLWNSTASGPVYKMEMDHFLKNPDTTLTGNIQFAARYGLYLYVKPAPSVENILTAYYSTYPAALASGDNLAFSNYDDLILNCAMQYSWAALEETESSKNFDSIIQTMLQASSLSTVRREVVEKGVLSGINLQGTQAQG